MKSIKTAYWYIAVPVLLWPGMEVALKYVSGQFNPLQLTFSRVLVGGLILLPLALRSLRQREKRLEPGTLKELALLGLLGIAFSMTVNQLAVMHAPATVVSGITSGNPVFIAALGWLLFKQPLERYKYISLALDLAGITAIIQPWNLHLTLAGVIFSLLAPLTFALYSVLSRKLCIEYGGLTVTSLCFLFGAAEMIAVAGLTHIPQVAEMLSAAGLSVFARVPFFEGYTWANLPFVLYIYVGATGIGFCCYFMAIEKSSALHASLVFFFKPILGPVYAALLLHEVITTNVWIGIFCMILGAAVFVLPELISQQRQRKTHWCHSNIG